MHTCVCEQIESPREGGRLTGAATNTGERQSARLSPPGEWRSPPSSSVLGVLTILYYSDVPLEFVDSVAFDRRIRAGERSFGSTTFNGIVFGGLHGVAF